MKKHGKKSQSYLLYCVGLCLASLGILIVFAHANDMTDTNVSTNAIFDNDASTTGQNTGMVSSDDVAQQNGNCVCKWSKKIKVPANSKVDAEVAAKKIQHEGTLFDCVKTKPNEYTCTFLGESPSRRTQKICEDQNLPKNLPVGYATMHCQFHSDL